MGKKTATNYAKPTDTVNGIKSRTRHIAADGTAYLAESYESGAFFLIEHLGYDLKAKKHLEGKRIFKSTEAEVLEFLGVETL